MSFRSDLDALILAALQEGVAHGYEISKRIRNASRKVLKVGEGQLYPALHRLEEKGLVSAEWEQQEGKPARRVYTLTPGGAKELQEQKAAWKEFVQGVSGVLQTTSKLEGSNA